MASGATSTDRFPASHRWDPVAVAAAVGAIWAAILGGFIPDIANHVRTRAEPYPLILHIHAAVFTGWLVLLTVQVALIRSARTDLHRRLGALGAALALGMTVLGPATAVVMAERHWTTLQSDPGFLIVQFADIAAFAGLVGAGLLLRRDAAAHKRLMLLGTLALTDVGFSRIVTIFLPRLCGAGWWGLYADGALEVDLLVLALGLYDLVTRKQLHPVYLPAAAWIALLQVGSTVLYFTPAWRMAATRLLGH